MSDRESRSLDTRILSFIQKYRCDRSSEMDFELLALRVFNYQFERNNHYRKFCLLQAKTPGNIKSWREIPALPALAFKELALTSFPIKERVRVFRTSGTTGSGSGVSAIKVRHRASADAPLRGAHFFDTLRLYEAALLPPFEKAVLPDGARDHSFYFLIRPASAAPDSSLSYMMSVVNKRLALSRGRWYAKGSALMFERLADGLKREKKRVVLFSTAIALKGFLDHLRSRDEKLSLKRGSRLMETGGFKGRAGEVPKSVLYGQCEKYLGLPRAFCISEYGMTELSSQMYAVASGIFRGPAWLRTLVIDPATGQEIKKGKAGLLRHIDLANRGSVMAVQTEDLGRAAGEGFELLGRAKRSELRGCSLAYETFIRRGE